MLPPGTLLQERYRLVCSVAQGGMGVVYQAIDQRLGHNVAIKQIIHHQELARAAFEQEARLLAALRHPRLPSVTDYFVEPVGHFLVMDFIPGDDLATYALRQKEAPALEEVLRWADQLLDLLIYLHSQSPPVIHRDIKPSNLKLDEQGAVILLDFGLAKGLPGPNALDQSIAGYTLHYAAPEQVRGETSDARSDLYSLAATLYDLLASVRPANTFQRLAAISAGQPDPLQPLSTLNPAVPAAIAAVIQRALALAPRERFADAAAMRLALHSASGDATQLVAAPAGASTPHPIHNLPAQLTSFVAREAEIAAIRQLLQRPDLRLVTLSGPGGIGKTRLALAVAMRELANFADGVCFVSLAAISDSSLLLPTIAQTLGLRESLNTTAQQNLHVHLHDKELLLLLDNFEQIVSAAPAISELLVNTTRLKILVTSREALQISGEQEFPVPVLELPDVRQLSTPETLAQIAAVRLFVQRAQAVKPNFVLDSSNAAAIAGICKRLDGLPLALELAAASVKVLSAPAILTRLAERIDLPNRALRDLPDRQRTLHASIQWSYDLLSKQEKQLFRRLSIFHGSFALAAAEALCARTGLDATLALDTMASLVSKSLLKPLEGEDEGKEVEPRFTLLETIREFGLKQLAAEGESATVAAAHAAYYAALIQEAEGQIWGAKMAEAVSRLDEENENVRATLAYYLAQPQGAATSLHLAGSLWRFWEIRGYIQEGRAWLDRALQRRAEVPPAGLWLPLHAAGNLAVDEGDYELSNTHYLDALHLLQGMLPTLTEPLRIARTRHAIGNTLANLGHTAIFQCRWAEATAFSHDAIAIHRQNMADAILNRATTLVGLAIPITNLAMIELYQSNYAEAERFASEGLTIYRELGDERGIGWNLHSLGIVARDRGEDAKAAHYFQETKFLFEKIVNQADMPALYFDLGELAWQQGDYDRAEAAYQAGLTLAQRVGRKKEEANLLNRLSLLARQRGNYATATTLNTESLAMQRALGNLVGLSDALQTRGEIELAQQNFAAAAADLRESLQLKTRLGESKGMVSLFKQLATLCLAQSGEADRAVRLLAAAESLRLDRGIALAAGERAADNTLLDEMRAALGEAAFAAAWAAGQCLDLAAAIALALEEN